MKKFTVETFSDYLKRTFDDIESGRVVDYAISTMKMFARPGSLVEQFLDCLKRHDFKVCYDKALTDRVYILPDGHYVFRILPRGRKKNRIKHLSDEISRQTNQKYAGIMVSLAPRFFQIKSNSSWWRKLRSLHVLQALATSHLKVAVAADRGGHKSVTVLTGEMSSESRQNNLSLTLQSAAAYNFVKKILNPNYQIGRKLFEACRVSKRLTLVADYGNYGAPSAIPKIHQLAQDMISDQPKSILLVSQYNPSGRILKALNKAAKSGAKVTIPLQPANDYRRRDGGFIFLFAKFKLLVNRQISLPTRPQPSHVKCLIVEHTSGQSSMIFGSDNFESWAETYYRNTELAAVITKARPGDEEYKIIAEMRKVLIKTGEIPQ